MEHPADPDTGFRQGPQRPSLREAADPDDEPGIEHVDRLPQRQIAGGEQRRLLLRPQPVRGQVRAALQEKRQRAVVPDQEPLEEGLRAAEAPLRPPPHPAAADLAPAAVEAEDRPFRMLIHRRLHRRVDAEPVPHPGDLAEWNAGLGHPPGTRIHADQHDPARSVAGQVQIRAMSRPGVDQRVVDVGDGRTEAQTADGAGKTVRNRRKP